VKSFGLCTWVTAAMLVVSSGPFQAQPADNVVRSWSCLAASGAAQSSLRAIVTNPACSPAPTITSWPPFGGIQRAADVISPPGPPSGLAASVSGSTVVVTWAAPGAGGAPTQYVIQAGSSSGQANLANSGTGSTSTQLTANGVPAGVYFVRVLAQNASGTSAPSNEIVVTVGGGGCSTSPSAPTGFATAVDGSTVTLSWQPPSGGCAPTAYTIQAGSAPGGTNLANFSTGNTATSYTAGGVGAGTYYVRVLATNAGGGSAPSNEVQLVVGGTGCTPPTAPSGLTASVSGSTLTLNWIAASGTFNNYAVHAGSLPGKSDLGVANVGSTATTFTVAGVPNGTYYIRVFAFGPCGAGGTSNEVAVVVGGPGRSGVSVTAVHGFIGSPSDGSNWSNIIQGSDGNFYGTSVTGGPFNPACNSNLTGCGLIFRLTPSGTFTVLYTFTGTTADHNAQPIYPYGRLLQASDGNFYGTTSEGPAVFRMTPAGSVTILTFLGGGSYGNLIQGGDGNFYGTTAFGGAGTCSPDRSAVCFFENGSGTVFRMTPGGALTTLHVFTGGADGSKPYTGLILASDGSFYGTTQAGAAGFGTVFKIRADGTFTTLYTFTGGADGAYPYAALIQASDGNFYGTTLNRGGPADAGTLFRMTPAGALTVLHAFTGFNSPDNTPRPGQATDGAFPVGALVQGRDGNLYGTTGGGGGLGGGTAFVISLAGNYAQVFPFSGLSEGSSPTSGLIVASDGNFYGTCQYGGIRNMGAIFRMTPP
jgi:uncharacterized repeat protein (TIGR03803 family)